MSGDLPSAVMGATTTVKTMSDGTLRIQVDIDPRHAKDAFSMFGAPGTPVALARLDPAAATAAARRDMEPAAPEGHGKHYAALYRGGWFYNPRVVAAFGLKEPSQDTPDKIKAALYTAFDVESLADIDPADFRLLARKMAIEDTLPRGFGQP